MKIRQRDTGLGWADVTPREFFFNRRAFLAAGGAALIAGNAWANDELDVIPSQFSTDEQPNALPDIARYNNFYEFGLGKGDPARYAGALTTQPWSIRIDGLVERPGDYSFEEILDGVQLEERIYRLRCVEAWSMVVPWVGFELGELLRRVGVQPSARHVAFETLVRPEEMRGQRVPMLDWPYREGLRLDEAMHPLTILATGIYRQPIPNQNGAPIRLVVPWKYGFKSIKSIVRITLTEEEPLNTWQDMAPDEYGYYANVNPEVDHPRWSQASERRIGMGLFARRMPTRMFNGYGDQVAHLYEGMDLRRYY
ncbi:protein-methionine-sulfoxide reductase catalytic subunit MsrP [Alkalilacustris brevis]|uniref:protein-methionine-sulfoxide reductase catalytic subunit MsrP n=1 Tax=Alkalilacustris brevis TaxID=2026338 RepID=UPI000E0D2FC5|nr:protein-methionine-sulfoxide reductase catalytic subunit MsrP [Alkalilacustris brevis]